MGGATTSHSIPLSTDPRADCTRSRVLRANQSSMPPLVCGEIRQKYCKDVSTSSMSRWALGIHAHSMGVVDMLWKRVQASTKSRNVSQSLRSLRRILQCKKVQVSFHDQFQASSSRILFADSPHVRAAAVEVAAILLPNPFPLLMAFCADDSSAKVRKVSLQQVLMLHRRGAVSTVDGDAATLQALWENVDHAVRDNDAEVRLESVRLMWLMARQHSSATINGEHLPQQLVDAAFERMCAAVNDTSIRVRSEAVALLGRFRGVSNKLLLQSFSKKVLVHDPLSASRRPKDSALVPGDFDISSKHLNLCLSDTLAAGAFVHGLEDEYQAVRMNAIDSICELAVQHREQFAEQAVDFLIDMFNDAIEPVRRNAIDSLRKIGASVPLKEDALSIVLSTLNDASDQVRRGVHRLLAQVRFANMDCCWATIHALLHSLKKHWYDTSSVFACLEGIGRLHSGFVELLLDELLHLEKYFTPVEAQIEDRLYQGIMVMVCNAAVQNQNIISLLPNFAPRHYRYLKERYPQYIPHLEPLSGVTSNFENSQHSIMMDLSHDSADDEIIEPTQLTTFEEKIDRFVSILSSIDVSSAPNYPHLASELINLSNELRHKFIGLRRSDCDRARNAHLCALFICAMVCDSPLLAQRWMVRLKEETEVAVRALQLHGCDVPSAFSYLQELSSTLKHRWHLYNVFLMLLRDTPFLDSNSCVMSPSIQWLRPSLANERAKATVFANVPHRIHIEATLDGFYKTSDLCLVCVYPDKSEQVIPLQPHNFQSPFCMQFLLKTTIRILPPCARTWTEQCAVMIHLGRRIATYPPLSHNAGSRQAHDFVLYGRALPYQVLPREVAK